MKYLNTISVLCLGIVVWLCLVCGVSRGQDYRMLYSIFDAPSGVKFYGTRAPLVPGPDGLLYGTTYAGSHSIGAVYSAKTDGTGLTLLKHFAQTNSGEGLMPTIVIAGGTKLYGGAMQGGVANVGTLFRLNTDGSGYTVLKSFTGATGGGPYGLVLSGDTLYGTTSADPASTNGILFRINTDGSGYAIVKTFNGDDGAGPGYLILSGDTLYGTTGAGGAANNGTIFSIKTDGTGFAVLKSLAGPTDGSGPQGALLLAGATLYGTANRAGPLGGGTVFKMSTEGNGFTVIKSFASASEAFAPYSLVTDGTFLYGSAGSATYPGVIFKLNLDGSGFSLIKTFAPGEGGFLPTLCSYNSTLYGTTEDGGAWLHGTVFALQVAPPIITSNPSDCTAEEQGSASFGVGARGSQPLRYQWWFKGSILFPSGTNAVLARDAIKVSDAGAYKVVVANALGAATSAPAMLQVIPGVPRRPVPAINVSGETGSVVTVQYLSALSPNPFWINLDAVTLDSSPKFFFDTSLNQPMYRLYRGRQTNTPAAPLSLSLPCFVPAITLTGSIGDHVQIDYINVVGPTNAWVTLSTATLTGVPQLYFDLSAPGQPARLYRTTRIP